MAEELLRQKNTGTEDKSFSRTCTFRVYSLTPEVAINMRACLGRGLRILAKAAKLGGRLQRGNQLAGARILGFALERSGIIFPCAVQQPSSNDPFALCWPLVLLLVTLLHFYSSRLCVIFFCIEHATYPFACLLTLPCPFPSLRLGENANVHDKIAAADLGLLAVAPRSIEGHVEFQGVSSSTGQR